MTHSLTKLIACRRVLSLTIDNPLAPIATRERSRRELAKTDELINYVMQTTA